MALWRKNKAQDAASLVVVSLAGREDLLPDFAYPLGREEQVVGRHESSSIQLVDSEVSRQHLRIRFDSDIERYFAVDMGSANGTLINGNRIQREVRLEENDVIEVGNSRLIFTRRKFSDHKTALNHFRKHGETGKGTLIR